MRITDLSVGFGTGDNYHLNTEITDHLTHAETKDRLEYPAEGFAVRRLVMSDHSATHVDAPVHFIPGGKTIDQTPLDIYAGPARVVDFSGDTGDQGELALPDFAEKTDNEHIEIRAGDCVLFRFEGENGKVYSGLSEDLSGYLASRKVRLVGTDQPSIDWSENKSRPAHRILLSAGIPVVEMLTNLDAVKGKEATFMGFPLKITGATGSPIRAVAIQQQA